MKLSGDMFKRAAGKAGDVIAYFELVRLGGGWTYNYSNTITLGFSDGSVEAHA